MRTITRICVLFLWIHALTFATGQDCTIESFVKGPLYDTNFDTSNLDASYSHGRQVRVNCNIGYSGFFKLICNAGNWQSRGSRCQPKSCGHPGDAQFADFHLDNGDDFVFGSKVVYTCHEGYQMVSRTNFRRCMAEGWDGVVPVCEAQQCPVIHVDNNVQVNGDPEEATFGNVVRFGCKISTEILYGSPEIYCDENGEWSAPAPKCKEVKCPTPSIDHGRIIGEEREYNEHEVLPFRCNYKYRPTEERPSKCTKVGLRAEWSPTPVCEPTKCRLKLPPLQGTSYEPAFRNVFLPGETLTVICDKKYWIHTTLETSLVATCNDNGEWSDRPICQEVICSNPQDRYVDRWGAYWQRLTLGDTSTYRCRSGYKSTDGSNRAECTRSGWEPKPLCQEIICDKLELDNASLVRPKLRYKNNQKATYVCLDGYFGNPTRVCRENGWFGDTQCTEITCTPRLEENASVDGFVPSLYKNGERAEYTCNEGYEGGFTLTCGINGWTGWSNCRRRQIQCKRLDIDNAYITSNNRQSYSHRDEVYYACRYKIDSTFVISCINGVWTGVKNCSACPTLEIPHGFTVGPYNDKMYYSCKEGYKLFNQGWWGEATCENHVWSGHQQCIDENECGKIPAIPNGRAESSDQAYRRPQSAWIECDRGFMPQIERLICHDGKWSSDGTPLKNICASTKNKCSPPPKVENTVIITSYQKEYISGSSVIYQCRKEYMMEGGTSPIHCIDGEWETTNIKCLAYCDILRDETLRIERHSQEKEIFRNGERLLYLCTANGAYIHGYATCIDGKWNKSVECVAPTQEQ